MGTAAACAPLGGKKQEKEFASLAAMSEAEYSEILLTVTTSFAGDFSLVSNYTASREGGNLKVVYEVERFAEIGDWESVPQTAKQTVKGEAVLQDGKFVTLSGEQTALSETFLEGKYSFRAEYFENAAFEEDTFRGDVTDAAGFFGDERKVSDVKVEASYGARFTEMNVLFKEESGNNVQYRYRFIL